MIFPVQYLKRSKSSELKSNGFESWYSREFAETFSITPGITTSWTILKQHVIQEDRVC